KYKVILKTTPIVKFEDNTFELDTEFEEYSLNSLFDIDKKIKEENIAKFEKYVEEKTMNWKNCIEEVIRVLNKHGFTIYYDFS
ncbi:MAG: hypothetical protein NZ934_04580, partial [Hadesarchaea archaeon]|nr:hypothetical protein [Hadesarchaea archaeon]